MRTAHFREAAKYEYICTWSTRNDTSVNLNPCLEYPYPDDDNHGDDGVYRL